MTTPPYTSTIERVRTALGQTFGEIDDWFNRPESLRAYQPASGGWSIDEVLEHVTLTSHFLLIVIRQSAEKGLKRAGRGTPIPAGESDLDLLEPIGRRGSFSWSRPEHMIPTGAVPSREVRERMGAQYRDCISILDRLRGGEGALHKVRISVNGSGRLDVYQWLYFLAQHAARHIEQMRENEAKWLSRPSVNCA
ncbi:MAG TPA: DinB family protein [Thermoanaerobaculia bacterium]|nr:DinB family protein [Thermoanaerobaculia bacterium]